MNSTVGLVSYEGDLGTTGDGATIRGGAGLRALGGPNTGSPPLNATNNLFDSSISAGNALVTSRAPADRNAFGFDADLFPLPNVLGNNQTSTEVRLTTGGDAYQPGVVTIATDLFAPRIVAGKTASAAEADPGDTITYTVVLSNTGQDGAEEVVLTDDIPANTSYVPGSLAINGAGQSDAADTDRGEVAGGTVTARVGTGANGTTGGALPPGGPSVTVTFQVAIDTVVPPSTVVANSALRRLRDGDDRRARRRGRDGAGRDGGPDAGRQPRGHQGGDQRPRSHEIADVRVRAGRSRSRSGSP